MVRRQNNQDNRGGRRWLPNVSVTWCYDWRGINDDELTFMFKGAEPEMIKEVFRFLCAKGNGCARGYRIEYGHDAIRRPNHCYHRLMVTLVEWDRHFASPDDMMLLIESRLRNMTMGTLKPCNVEQFMNT